MRTLFIALSVLVLVTAGSLRADVAPFPSWRLAANDTITRVVQGGDVVYVGGRFSRLGEGLTPFVGAIDRATLAFAPRTGCSTEAGSPIDRRFRVVLPPRIDAGNVTVTDPVEANGHAYFRFTRSTFPRGGELQLTVEVDGVTGAMKRYWPELVGTTILPHGVTPAGRIVASATTGFDARGHRGVGVRKHGASRMAGPATRVGGDEPPDRGRHRARTGERRHAAGEWAVVRRSGAAGPLLRARPRGECVRLQWAWRRSDR